MTTAQSHSHRLTFDPKLTFTLQDLRDTHLELIGSADSNQRPEAVSEDPGL